MNSRAAWSEELIVERPSFAEVIELSVKSALLAPSTHNSQPWQVSYLEKGIELFDTDRNLRHSDPERIFHYISLGAFIENFSICAEYYGYALSVEFKTSSYLLSLTKSGNEKTTNGHLLREVTRRHSEKRIFDSSELADSKLVKLLGISSEQELTLVISNDPEVIKKSAQLYFKAAESFKDNKFFARELSSWMKLWFGSSGMHPRSSGLKTVQTLVGKSLLKITPKVLEKMASKYLRLINESNAVGFIGVTNSTRESYVSAGRLLERTALKACQNDLSLTPLAAIIQHSQGLDFLRKMTKSRFEPVIFFRLADYKEPVAHTARRSANQICRRD